MRILGATEVAENPRLLRRTLRNFEQFEKSDSTARTIFPWLLTPAYLTRLVLGAVLHMDFSKIIKARRKTGKRQTDAIQHLLDQGADMDLIIKVSSINFVTKTHRSLIVVRNQCSSGWTTEYWYQRRLVTHFPLPEPRMADKSQKGSGWCSSKTSN
jgi:hypothetical protein